MHTTGAENGRKGAAFVIPMSVALASTNSCALGGETSTHNSFQLEASPTTGWPPWVAFTLDLHETSMTF